MGQTCTFCADTREKDDHNQELYKLRETHIAPTDTSISTEASESTKNILKDDKSRFSRKRRTIKKKNRMRKSRSAEAYLEDFDDVDFSRKQPEVDLTTMETLPLSLALPSPSLISREDPNFILFQHAATN